MRGLELEFADDVRKLAERINEALGLGLDLGKVAFIRSRGSKSKAIARALALPSQWRFVLKPQVIYVVEVLSEKFDSMSCLDKMEVVLHELLHIPKSMSGGLRGHNYSEFRRIKKYRRALQELCLSVDHEDWKSQS